MAVHNAEEALFFPRYTALVLGRLPPEWRTLGAPLTLGQVWSALAVLTLLPVVLALLASRAPRSPVLVWLLLLIQATLLLNVVWHAGMAALMFDGYAPGLVTGLLVNLPVAMYLLRRAVREEWVSRGLLWALIPGALVFHGPLLGGLLLLTERVG